MDNHNTHLLSENSNEGHGYKYDKFGNVLAESIDDLIYDKFIEMKIKKRRDKEALNLIKNINNNINEDDMFYKVSPKKKIKIEIQSEKKYKNNSEQKIERKVTIISLNKSLFKTLEKNKDKDNTESLYPIDTEEKSKPLNLKNNVLERSVKIEKKEKNFQKFDGGGVKSAKKNKKISKNLINIQKSKEYKEKDDIIEITKGRNIIEIISEKSSNDKNKKNKSRKVKDKGKSRNTVYDVYSVKHKSVKKNNMKDFSLNSKSLSSDNKKKTESIKIKIKPGPWTENQISQKIRLEFLHLSPSKKNNKMILDKANDIKDNIMSSDLNDKYANHEDNIIKIDDDTNNKFIISNSAIDMFNTENKIELSVAKDKFLISINNNKSNGINKNDNSNLDKKDISNEIIIQNNAQNNSNNLNIQNSNGKFSQEKSDQTSIINDSKSNKDLFLKSNVLLNDKKNSKSNSYDITKNELTKNELTKNDITKNDITKNDITKNDITKIDEAKVTIDKKEEKDENIQPENNDIKDDINNKNDNEMKEIQIVEKINNLNQIQDVKNNQNNNIIINENENHNRIIMKIKKEKASMMGNYTINFDSFVFMEENEDLKIIDQNNQNLIFKTCKIDNINNLSEYYNRIEGEENYDALYEALDKSESKLNNSKNEKDEKNEKNSISQEEKNNENDNNNVIEINKNISFKIEKNDPISIPEEENIYLKPIMPLLYIEKKRKDIKIHNKLQKCPRLFLTKLYIDNSKRKKKQEKLISPKIGMCYITKEKNFILIKKKSHNI